MADVAETAWLPSHCWVTFFFKFCPNGKPNPGCGCFQVVGRQACETPWLHTWAVTSHLSRDSTPEPWLHTWAVTPHLSGCGMLQITETSEYDQLPPRNLVSPRSQYEHKLNLCYMKSMPWLSFGPKLSAKKELPHSKEVTIYKNNWQHLLSSRMFVIIEEV